MLRLLFGVALIVACVWTDFDRHVLAQTIPAANSDASIIFALLPPVQPSHQPVEFDGLVLDDRVLPFDQPLHLPPDWPTHLSIRLRNVSLLPISYVMLNLSFPESETSNMPAYGHQVHLGNLIPVQARNRSGELVRREQIESLMWRPNTEVTIPLITIVDTVAAANRVHQPISRLIVFPPRVQFQDVSLWDGAYHRCQQDGSHCVDASFSDFSAH